MKISGVDRCGCLIQSAPLESTGPDRTFQSSCSSLRTASGGARAPLSDVAQSNEPTNERTNLRVQSAFLFSSWRHCAPPRTPPRTPKRDQARRRRPRRSRFVQRPRLLCRFDSVSERRISLLWWKRFAAEGYSYRFLGAFRPFQPFPLSHLSALSLPFSSRSPYDGASLPRKMTRYSGSRSHWREEIEPATIHRAARLEIHSPSRFDSRDLGRQNVFDKIRC